MKILMINKFLYPNGEVKLIYLSLANTLRNRTMRFNILEWNTKAAAWATVSMLIHLIWTSTAAAN